MFSPDIVETGWIRFFRQAGMASTITNDPDGTVYGVCWVVWYWLRSGIGLGYHRLSFAQLSPVPLSLLYSGILLFPFTKNLDSACHLGISGFGSLYFRVYGLTS